MIKKILVIYVVLFSIHLKAQEDNLENELGKLFLNFDLKSTPKELEKVARVVIDFGEQIPPEKNVIKLDKHPYFNFTPYVHLQYLHLVSNKTYLFNDVELFDKYGIYQIYLVFTFDREFDCFRLYELLTEKYKDYASKTFITNTVNKHKLIENAITIYQKNNNSQIPRLSFTYSSFNSQESPEMKEDLYKLEVKLILSHDDEKLNTCPDLNSFF